MEELFKYFQTKVEVPRIRGARLIYYAAINDIGVCSDELGRVF